MDDPEPLLQYILLSSIIKSISIETILSIGVVILLLIFSALISGSEIAFFSLSPTEKDELNSEKNKLSEKVISLLKIPKRLLATILISNNFINVAIIILSTYIVESVFNFGKLPNWFSFLTQVVSITFILLLFGEIIPKIYATKHALKLSKLMVRPLLILKSIFNPISSILISSTRIIDKRLKRRGLDITVENLSLAIDLAKDIPENNDEHRILKGIVNFGETNVKQIMKSRVDVFAVDKNTTYNDLLTVVIESGFSRIPVFEGSFDYVIGVLYIKDLLPFIDKKESFNWQKLIRHPFFIPENKKLDDLLKEFQDKKVHLAIVVDEYGGTSGIVTLEDILEEIVGEISDEFDEDDITYSKLDDNNYVFEAKTSLNDLRKILEIDDEHFFKEVQDEVDTLAGLVIELAGKIPLKGEKFNFKNLNFIIEASDKRKVKRIKLNIINEKV